MTEETLKSIHPGEVLREEFLKPLLVSEIKLAESIAVSPEIVRDIVIERRGISTYTAHRLGKFFGTSAEFWLGLQADYDLDVAHRR